MPKERYPERHHHPEAEPEAEEPAGPGAAVKPAGCSADWESTEADTANRHHTTDHQGRRNHPGHLKEAWGYIHRPEALEAKADWGDWADHPAEDHPGEACSRRRRRHLPVQAAALRKPP